MLLLRLSEFKGVPMKNLLKYTFQIWSKYVLTWISVLSFVTWFIPNIPDELQFVKIIIGVVLFLILIISFIVIVVCQSKSKEVNLIINNTKVNIKFADIFSQPGIKVIAFNEYFDTLVDNVVINHTSLNGQVIDKGLIDAKVFDASVLSNIDLKKGKENKSRKSGKKQRYEIGQIHKYNDEYFALAFTKFNEKNEAHLSSNEYSGCLLEMWRQLNTYYSQSIINIPLLGDGITRILDNTSITKQELLEIMLETLKISKMTFKEPSEVNIVLYAGLNNANHKYYDFSKIKMMFK